MTEESFDNVSINSEGSSEDISMYSQDEWDDGDTVKSTDNQRNILKIYNFVGYYTYFHFQSLYFEINKE